MFYGFKTTSDVDTGKALHRFKKAHVTHPELKMTFCLEIVALPETASEFSQPRNILGYPSSFMDNNTISPIKPCYLMVPTTKVHDFLECITMFHQFHGLSGYITMFHKNCYLVLYWLFDDIYIYIYHIISPYMFSISFPYIYMYTHICIIVYMYIFHIFSLVRMITIYVPCSKP